MPLAKLWNFLFGNSQPTESSKSTQLHGSDAVTRKLAIPTTPDPAVSRSSLPVAPSDVQPAVKHQPAAKRRVRDLVSGGPHASLCRMIKKSGATSVLEVGVGDGSRATAVLSTLAKTQPETGLKYIAIDLFEMGEGTLTLREFHQQVRSIDVKPNLIPMPWQQGLTRVAHTFGSVDLVLLADRDVDACDPLLDRVTKPSSLILRWDGQNWQQIPRQNQVQGRQRAVA